MRGLLLKDFYMIWKQMKLYFVVDIAFIAVSFFTRDNIIFLAVPIMLAGVMPLTLLAFDERSGWLEYAGALPYSKAQIVSGKYLTGLILQAATALAVFITLIIRDYSYSLDYILFVTMTLFAAALIFPTLCLPFSFGFGTEKGRIIYLVVIAAVVGVGALLADSSAGHAIFYDRELCNAVMICSPALFVLSWESSSLLYKYKKTGK